MLAKTADFRAIAGSNSAGPSEVETFAVLYGRISELERNLDKAAMRSPYMRAACMSLPLYEIAAGSMVSKPGSIADLALTLGIAASWMGFVTDAIEEGQSQFTIGVAIGAALENAVMLLATIDDLPIEGEALDLLNTVLEEIRRGHGTIGEVKSTGGTEIAEPQLVARCYRSKPQGRNPSEASTWDDLRIAYEQAKAAEDAYYGSTWGAQLHRFNQTSEPIDAAVEIELNRLMSLRSATEEAVMEAPSSTGGDFALKFLIAKGDGRETDVWDELLIRDARRVASGGADPHMGWLSEYQRLCAAREAEIELDPDSDNDAAHAAMREIARRITTTPATTRDGLLAKAIIVADFNVGPDDTDDANIVMAEAKALGVIEYVS